MNYKRLNTIYLEFCNILEAQNTDDYFDVMDYAELLSGEPIDVLLAKSAFKYDINQHWTELTKLIGIYAMKVKPIDVIMLGGKTYKIPANINSIKYTVGHMATARQIMTNIVRKYGNVTKPENATDEEVLKVESEYYRKVNKDIIMNADNLCSVMLHPIIFSKSIPANTAKEIDAIKTLLQDYDALAVVSLAFFLTKKLVTGWLMLADYLAVTGLSINFKRQLINYINMRPMLKQVTAAK